MMATEKAVMTTIDEVYFLVRVGSWDENDLENYIQERADNSNQVHYDDGYKDGYHDGGEDGKRAMYKEALDAIKCLE